MDAQKEEVFFPDLLITLRSYEAGLAVNGYPNYQHRDNGMAINVGKYQVDNRWIVPYNLCLSKKFNTHINLRHTHLRKALTIFSHIYIYIQQWRLDQHRNKRDKYPHSSWNLHLLRCKVYQCSWGILVSVWKQNACSFSCNYPSPCQLATEKKQVYFRAGNEEEAVQKATTRNTILTAFSNTM